MIRPTHQQSHQCQTINTSHLNKGPMMGWVNQRMMILAPRNWCAMRTLMLMTKSRMTPMRRSWPTGCFHSRGSLQYLLRQDEARHQTLARSGIPLLNSLPREPWPRTSMNKWSLKITHRTFLAKRRPKWWTLVSGHQKGYLIQIKVWTEPLKLHHRRAVSSYAQSCRWQRRPLQD